jgi:hypothetical protein
MVLGVSRYSAEVAGHSSSCRPPPWSAVGGSSATNTCTETHRSPRCNRAGYHFPPLGHIDPIGLVRSVMTYLWLPTEYVRNVVDAPGWVDLLVVALSLAGAFGVVRVVVRLWPGRSVVTLVAIAVLAVATWLVTAIATQAVAFASRTRHYAVVLGLGGLVLLRGGGRSRILVLVAELCVSGWFLLSVSDLSPLLTRFTPEAGRSGHPAWACSGRSRGRTSRLTRSLGLQFGGTRSAARGSHGAPHLGVAGNAALPGEVRRPRGTAAPRTPATPASDEARTALPR